MKVNFKSSEIRIKFKEQIDNEFGKKQFTKEEAKASATKAGLSETEFKSIYTHVLRHFKIDKNVFCFADIPESEKKEKKEMKATLKRDLEVINESVDPVAQKWEKKAEEAKSSFKTPVIKTPPIAVMSLIPKKDPQYVTWGHFKDIQTIIKSKIFYPIFVTGLSGNGKTSMIHQVCSKLKRDMVRINITIETDEDDLLGGFRLVDGETVWQDGPLVVAMKSGAIALIDEVDLASHKIMCLQPIMEGQPIYLKKINQMVYPEQGFNIVATANTKGKGSEDGRFMGTNILNEAFLDRFSATFFQEYPSVAHETKILKKQFATFDIIADEFVEKLVKWADVIRKSFKEGAVDEIVTTRRLIDITKSYSIFEDKMKAVTMCLERFDDETREAFTDLYTKIDAGVDLNPEEENVEAETMVSEKQDEKVPF
jgi:MoxR-like ATPase